MEYVYATLLVTEAGGELNQENLTAVLEAAGCDVSESRVRALVAALEGLDLGTLDAAALAEGATVAEADFGTEGTNGANAPDPGPSPAPPDGDGREE